MLINRGCLSLYGVDDFSLHRRAMVFITHQQIHLRTQSPLAGGASSLLFVYADLAVIFDRRIAAKVSSKLVRREDLHALVPIQLPTSIRFIATEMVVPLAESALAYQMRRIVAGAVVVISPLARPPLEQGEHDAGLSSYDLPVLQGTCVGVGVDYDPTSLMLRLRALEIGGWNRMRMRTSIRWPRLVVVEQRSPSLERCSPFRDIA